MVTSKGHLQISIVKDVKQLFGEQGRLGLTIVDLQYFNQGLLNF